MKDQYSGHTGAAAGSRIASLKEGQDGSDYWPIDVRRAATNDEELFCLFVGPNASKYIKTYRAIVEGDGRAWSFNWVVLLAGLPWFFYRRMYLAGIGILILPILLAVLFPGFAQAGIPGFAAVLAVMANRWYVNTAIARIDKIRALDLPPDEQAKRIYLAGGVSIAGAVFGAVIVLSLAALPLVATYGVSLPGCGSARVQHLAKESIAERLNESGVRAMGLTLSDFKAVQSAPDGSSHICEFQVGWGSEQHTYYLGVSWSNRKTGEYRVNMGPSMDGLVP